MRHFLLSVAALVALASTQRTAVPVTLPENDPTFKTLLKHMSVAELTALVSTALEEINFDGNPDASSIEQLINGDRSFLTSLYSVVFIVKPATQKAIVDDLRSRGVTTPLDTVEEIVQATKNGSSTD